MSPERQPSYSNQPLQPTEILQTQYETFPGEVFVAVNGLIIEKLEGAYSKFTVKELRQRMTELGLDPKEVETRGWDRIGSIYKAAGWDVKYFSPSSDSDYDGPFDPFYVFNTQGYRNW